LRKIGEQGIWDYLEQSDKQVIEACKRHEYGRNWLSWLLPAPCPEICSYRWVKPLTRFHFACLTCPERIYHYKKRGHETLKKVNTVVLISHSVSGKGIVFPKRYYAYALIFNMGRKHSFLKLRDMIVRMLLTLAERVAEWQP
jgi:hypothetical protein